MTWTDPIVAEVRAVRDEHARNFGYDLARILEDAADLPPATVPGLASRVILVVHQAGRKGRPPPSAVR